MQRKSKFRVEIMKISYEIAVEIHVKFIVKCLLPSLSIAIIQIKNEAIVKFRAQLEESGSIPNMKLARNPAIVADKINSRSGPDEDQALESRHFI